MEMKQITKQKKQIKDDYEENRDYKKMPIGELVRTLQKDPETIRQAEELIAKM